MMIAIGSDHAGYALKTHLSELLARAGHEIEDVGTHSEEPTDYPAFCAAVGRLVTGVGVVLEFALSPLGRAGFRPLGDG